MSLMPLAITEGVVIARLLSSPWLNAIISAWQPSAQLFPSSSVVERAAVNRLVVGSSPTSGASFSKPHLKTRKPHLDMTLFDTASFSTLQCD
jgi:hypothetical protein